MLGFSVRLWTWVMGHEIAGTTARQGSRFPAAPPGAVSASRLGTAHAPHRPSVSALPEAGRRCRGNRSKRRTWEEAVARNARPRSVPSVSLDPSSRAVPATSPSTPLASRGAVTCTRPPSRLSHALLKPIASFSLRIRATAAWVTRTRGHGARHCGYRVDAVPACRSSQAGRADDSRQQEDEIDRAKPERGVSGERAWFWGQASHPAPHVAVWHLASWPLRTSVSSSLKQKMVMLTLWGSCYN